MTQTPCSVPSQLVTAAAVLLPFQGAQGTTAMQGEEKQNK